MTDDLHEAVVAHVKNRYHGRPMIVPSVHSVEVYSGKSWKIRKVTLRSSDGCLQEKEIASRPDMVHVLPVFSSTTMVLLREYRTILQRWISVIPSGKDKVGESMVEAAQRELREEAGYRSDDLQHAYTTFNTDALDSKNHFFIGRKLSKDPLPPDPTEKIEVYQLTFRDALKRVENEERDGCFHGPTAYAIRRYIQEQGL